MLQYSIFYIKCVLDAIAVENMQTDFSCYYRVCIIVHDDEIYN